MSSTNLYNKLNQKLETTMWISFKRLETLLDRDQGQDIDQGRGPSPCKSQDQDRDQDGSIKKLKGVMNAHMVNTHIQVGNRIIIETKEKIIHLINLK